jgi:hypothetical protein
MEVAGIVSQILAVKDETEQLQISNTVLKATAIAGAIAAAEKAEQALPANPGPGLGGNLDVTA